MKNGFILIVIACLLCQCSEETKKTLDKGISAYNKHKYRQAIEIFNVIIKKDTSNIIALKYLGLSYNGLGKYDTAYIYFSKVFIENGKSYEICMDIGDVASHMGQNMEAFNFFMMAYNLDSSGVLINYNLAVIYWHYFNDNPKALYYLSREVSLYKTNANAYAVIGQIYLNMSNSDSCFYYYNKAINLDVNNDQFYLDRGCAHCAFDEWNEAIKDFSSCISLNPKCQDAIYFRGYALIKLNKYTEACADFSKLKNSTYQADADTLSKIYCAGK